MPPADSVLARGCYIADHLGHCAECHTPRNLLGARDPDRYWAGAEIEAQIAQYHQRSEGRDRRLVGRRARRCVGQGMKPDGDFVGGAMGQVVDSTAGKRLDRVALIAYMRRVPPKKIFKQ